MDATVDYYEVLGVPVTAERAEIKAAWSKLVQQYHPDMGDDADPKKFQEVQKAFDVLGDEDKRIDYDRARDLASVPAPAGEATQKQQSSYVSPGWGEAAPPQPTPAPRVNKDTWVPPHKRPSMHDPQPEPVAPEPEPAPVQKPLRVNPQEIQERPKGHESWRIEADPSIKPKVVRGWKSLWLTPLLTTGLAAFSGMMAIAAAGATSATSLVPLALGVLGIFAAAGTITDWTRLQAGKSSATGVMITIVVALVLVVLGIISSNHWITLYAVLVSIAAGNTVSSLHYKYVLTRTLPVSHLRKFAAFGKPGKYAPTSVQQIIERDLADRLEELFRIPSVRMYHGLGIPATREEAKAGETVDTRYGATILLGGHIGQAVTAGKKVALVSSVVWPEGHYTVDQYGAVLVDGQHTQFEVEPFLSDYRHWKHQLKGLGDVRLIVAVNSDGPTTFDMEGLPVEFMNARDVADSLGIWMVEDQDVLDRELNAMMAQHLVAR